MKLGTLVPLAPTLALGVAAAATLAVPPPAEAHHRPSDRSHRYERSDRGHHSHRHGYDRGYRKGYRHGAHAHHRSHHYRRYPHHHYRPHHPRRYWHPAPPVVYAPAPRVYAPPPVYYAPPPRVYAPVRPVYVPYPRYHRGGVHGSVSIGTPFFGFHLRF